MNSADNEIVTVRTVPFSPAEVLGAWTDPERLARWWGPNGFVNRFEEFDPRPGGTWRLVMHGLDGVGRLHQMVFVEIGPEGVSLDHQSQPEFRLVSAFEPAPEGARIVHRLLFMDQATRDALAPYLLGANEELFDRLEAELSRKD